MSVAVTELRQCQLDIRLVQNKLQEIASDERMHPDKSVPGDSHEKLANWLQIKRQFEKRRKLLKERLADLQAERLEMEAELSQSPASKATLGHIISSLLDIETVFTTNTWGDAWDKLSAFIDWLEQEEQKVKP